jgi:hypothetical protein
MCTILTACGGANEQNRERFASRLVLSFSRTPASTLVVLVVALVSRTSAMAQTEVTMAVDPRLIDLGSAVTFRGFVPVDRAGEEVVIESRECDAGSWIVVRRERSEAHGVWEATLNPLVTTRYRARWRASVTRVVVVATRPLLRFEQETRNRFSILVIANRFFGGSRGRLERFERSRSRWILARHVTLSRRTLSGQSAPRRAGWAYSGATFLSRLPVGARVRFVLPGRQAAPCYVGTTSLQLTVRR